MMKRQRPPACAKGLSANQSCEAQRISVGAGWLRGLKEERDSNGGTFKAYLTVPASGSGPGILLLQEIFGVNKSMREVADYHAEEGYVVLAPDLFWRLEPGIELGYSEADFGKAFGYYQRFDANQSIKD